MLHTAYTCLISTWVTACVVTGVVRPFCALRSRVSIYFHTKYYTGELCLNTTVDCPLCSVTEALTLDLEKKTCRYSAVCDTVYVTCE